MLNIDGLVTGIDTSSIIEGLLGVQQQQIDRYQSRRQAALERQGAVRTLEARLAALQSEALRLGRAAGNPLTRRVASVSDDAALIATATSSAPPGAIEVRVTGLAQAHQVATQGFADPSSAISHGTLTLRVGSRAPLEIVIDDSNDTLSGLADAINSAAAGVSATILRDSSGGQPYRLLLTSASTGTAAAIQVDADWSGTSGAPPPAFDFNNPVQAALDASLALGAGPGAITISSRTNEFRDVLPGLSLQVLTADPTRSVRVEVRPDLDAARDAVTDFVAGFNGVLELIAEQTRYDAATGVAGLLQGDRSILDLQSRLRATLQEVIPTANPRLNRLSSLGIRLTGEGQVEVDTARLEDVLAGRIAGVTANDVAKLFALDGATNHSGLRFVLGSTRTRASTTPYQVDVTRAAERAELIAGNPPAAITTIAAENGGLQLNIDGISLAVALPTGSYTATQLAAAIESAVNAHPDFNGRTLRVGVTSDGRLSLNSTLYGSESRVTVAGGTALADLGLTPGQTATGVDVAGQFLVGTTIESATGRGRLLIGNPDNAHTADLQLQVTLAPHQVVAGAEGEITVTRGVAALLSETLGSLLAPEHGRIASVSRQYEQMAETIQTTITRQNARFERQREALQRQFAAMEAALAQLQSTSSFLGTQLSGLGSLNSR